MLLWLRFGNPCAVYTKGGIRPFHTSVLCLSSLENQLSSTKSFKIVLFIALCLKMSCNNDYFISNNDDISLKFNASIRQLRIVFLFIFFQIIFEH